MIRQVCMLIVSLLQKTHNSLQACTWNLLGLLQQWNLELGINDFVPKEASLLMNMTYL